MHPLALILNLIAGWLGSFGYQPLRWAYAPIPVRRGWPRQAWPGPDVSNVGPFSPPPVMQQFFGPPGACAALTVVTMVRAGEQASAGSRLRNIAQSVHCLLRRACGRLEPSHPFGG